MARARLSLVVLLLTFAAACSSSNGTPSGDPGAPAAGSAAQAAPAKALNPVDLLVKAGGVPPAGATVGNVDARGNRFVDGTIGPDVRTAFEQITVYVWASPESAWPEKPSVDNTWYIRGDGWEADLTGIMGDSGGTDFPVPPEAVAEKLGGRVIPRG